MRYPFNGTYRITFKFGAIYTSIKGLLGLRHKGTDFGLPKGTPVVSTVNGTVVAANYKVSRGYGIVIIDSDKDKKISYYHLSKMYVKKGNKVKTGQKIGLSGSTGVFSTGPHLHFQLEVSPKGKNKWVVTDPMKYIHKGVR